MSVQLSKQEQKVEFNQKQTGTQNGTRESNSRQTDTGSQVSNSAGESVTTRALTEGTVTKKTAGEKVNIAFQVSFTIPIRSLVPVDPNATSSC